MYIKFVRTTFNEKDKNVKMNLCYNLIKDQKNIFKIKKQKTVHLACANVKCSRDIIKQKCYDIPLQAREEGGRKEKKKKKKGEKKNKNACNDLFRIKYVKKRGTSSLPVFFTA